MIFNNDPLDGPHLFLPDEQGVCLLCGSVVSWDAGVHADLSGEPLSFTTTEGVIDLALGQTRQSKDGERLTLVGYTMTSCGIVWDRNTVRLVDPDEFRRSHPAIVFVRWQDRRNER